MSRITDSRASSRAASHVAHGIASTSRARAVRALVLAFLLALGAPRGAMHAQDADAGETAGPARHQLPHSREITALAKRARTALERGDTREAAELLQRLARADNGLLIEPASLAADAAHAAAAVGVAEWARAQWAALPDDVRRGSGERARDEARAAFEHALEQHDAALLRETALTWPFEETAARAWLACGDLESACGRDESAARAWNEARRLGLEFPTRARAGDAAGTPPRRWLDGAAPREREHVPDGLLSDLASAWTLDVPTGPYLRRNGRDKHNLWPCVADGRVLFTNGIELRCADVSTGRPLWSSGEPAGWELWREDERPSEFFLGADQEFAWIAPAAADGVAVAALQVPWRDQENDEFQGIPIMRATPERRLFAFDLATGKRLWSHEPPPDWNGESGAFEQRMRVAGPPLVAQGRVWAPFCRMSGRIEFHVACFELASGKLLWSTWVVSGQGELNMFNRYLVEFCAPPLVLERGRIVAQTNLGVVALLDADTGSALWSAEYDSIPQPPVRGMRQHRRPVVWRNSPPRLAAGLVISAPTDAEQLLAFDAATGRREWSLAQTRFSSPRAAGALPSVLLGADADSVWLGGRVLGRWTRVNGLRGDGPLQAAWARPSAPEDDGAPRALLVDDVLIAPTSRGPEWIAAADGNVRAGAPDGWDRRAIGNVLVSGDRLYALSGWQLSTCLDWSALLAKIVQRLHVATASTASGAGADESALERDAAAAALELVELRQQRAAVLLERGRADAALRELDSLREDLARPTNARAQDAELRQRLEEVALREAEILASLGRAAEARARLDASLATATSPRQRVRLLLAGFELLTTDRAAERLAALEQLALLPPDLVLTDDATAAHADELFGAVLDAPAIAQLSNHRALALASWLGLMRAAILQATARPAAALVALQELLIAPQAADDLSRLALWAPIAERMRELAARDAGAGANADAASTAGGGARVHALAAYEPRADAELRAVDAARESPAQADALARVRRRYPLSQAAHTAQSRLCDVLLRARDVTQLAALAREVRAGRPELGALERPVLDVLSQALARTGNPELARAFAAALRGGAETSTPDVAPARAPEFELAGPLRDALDVALPCRVLGAFAWSPDDGRHGDARHGDAREGDEQARDESDGDADALARDALLLVWRNGRIEAWGTDKQDAPRWVAPLFADTPPSAAVASAGRVCLASDGRLVALDLASGELAWRSPTPGEEGCTLCAYSGVVLATSSVAGRLWLTAHDARSGTELWSYATRDRLPWQDPVCGEARIALLAPLSSSDARLIVLDGLRGTQDGDYELGFPLEPAAAHAAWIDAGRLLLPRFKRPRGQEQVLVRAYSLREGSLAWTLGASGGAELEGVLEHAGQRWLVTRMGRSAGADPSGALLRLDTRTGTADPLMRLRFGERVIGLLPGDTLQLAQPYVALFQDGARPETPLSFVELAHGVRWLQRLPASAEDIDFDGLPAPLVGARGVLVAWRQRDGGGGAPQVRASLYDRASGNALWQQALPGDLGAARELEWAALGSLVLGVADEEHFHLWDARK